jgi:hypothetical protein
MIYSLLPQFQNLKQDLKALRVVLPCHLINEDVKKPRGKIVLFTNVLDLEQQLLILKIETQNHFLQILKVILIFEIVNDPSQDVLI